MPQPDLHRPDFATEPSPDPSPGSSGQAAPGANGDTAAGTPLSELINSLAQRLAPNVDVYRGGFSTGEVAELRRLDADKGVDSTCAPFWRIVVNELEPAGLIREKDGAEDLGSWIAIIKSLAQMAGLHRPGRPFGTALAAADVSEMRLNRLLRARGEALYDQLRVTLHALASHGEGADGLDIAYFVLSDAGPDEDFRERVRRRVARFYYRAELKSDSSQTQDTAS